MDYFNIYSMESPTNEDIIVTVTPTPDIYNYTYRVYRDDIVISTSHVATCESSTITLNETGTYKIELLINDNQNTITSGVYIVDKTAPEIKVGSQSLKMRVGDKLNVMGQVKATDNIDGNITKSLTSNISELDLKAIGKQELIYTVSDRAGNTATKVVPITITKNNSIYLIGIQVIIITILAYTIFRITRYLKSIILEKRYGKYAVESDNSFEISLFDVIKYFYKNLLSSLGIVLGRSVVISKYAKRYNKYLIFTKDRYNNSLEIVAAKILCSLAFFFISVAAKAIQYKTFSFYGVLLPLISGYFVIDVINIVNYRMNRDKIENDLLQSVIIMNNAFKSGRSIVQAIELVGNELPGIIGEQFITMRKELSKGLSVEVVFARFAERIDIEEVNYLTASLTILNRTGGNIIKVFDSIENSLFMKKKLRLELDSLTGSSKVIMWVLFLVPIVYVLIISLLSPSYFLPFINTLPGLILLSFAFILYVVYIAIVSKILKVRM